MSLLLLSIITSEKLNSIFNMIFRRGHPTSFLWRHRQEQVKSGSWGARVLTQTQGICHAYSCLHLQAPCTCYGPAGDPCRRARKSIYYNFLHHLTMQSHSNSTKDFMPVENWGPALIVACAPTPMHQNGPFQHYQFFTTKLVVLKCRPPIFNWHEVLSTIRVRLHGQMMTKNVIYALSGWLQYGQFSVGIWYSDKWRWWMAWQVALTNGVTDGVDKWLWQLAWWIVKMYNIALNSYRHYKVC